MFRTKTVFIVGAGASCELGFPSGGKLLEEIAAALDIRFSDYNEMHRGDRQIYENFRALARTSDDPRMVNYWQHAAWRVRDAAHLGLSIDNVINQFVDDEMVAQAAKLGSLNGYWLVKGTAF